MKIISFIDEPLLVRLIPEHIDVRAKIFVFL